MGDPTVVKTHHSPPGNQFSATILSKARTGINTLTNDNAISADSYRPRCSRASDAQTLIDVGQPPLAIHSTANHCPSLVHSLP